MRFAGTALEGYMSTPDFTGLGRTMMQGNSLQRNAATAAEGTVSIAGIQGDAKVKSAGFEASAIKAGGQARGQAAIASGIGSMISGIAGGFGARGSGGGFGSWGSAGGSGSSTFNPNSVSKYGTAVQNPMDSFRNIRTRTSPSGITGPIYM